MWASHLGNPANTLTPTAPLELTEAAKRAVTAFDAVNESTESGRKPKGMWEGKTLVVETSRLDSPYLNASGVPLGPTAYLVERFTPTPDGSRLDYSLVVTDPDSLLKPTELRRIWVYRPGEEVLPFDCKEQP